MSNKLNFFSWIRDGVKDAVLLGVNDAVEQLGEPRPGDDISHRLLDVIRHGETTGETKLGQENRPRRLGRTLKDIEASEGRKAG